MTLINPSDSCGVFLRREHRKALGHPLSNQPKNHYSYYKMYDFFDLYDLSDSSDRRESLKSNNQINQ